MKKNVIITGASGNLGKATVEQFVSDGYRVIATVTPGKSLGYETTEDVTVREVDLTDEMAVTRFIEQTREEFDTLDAALLLVGAFALGDFSSTNSSDIQKMISLNFMTAYNAVKPIFAVMTEQQAGRIILIGSRPGINPGDAKSAVGYALSKGMIFQLAEILNEAGSKNNVVTHVVVPSTMDTPANRKAMPQVDPTDWVKLEDVAEAMAYLCSAKGRSIRQGVLKIYANS